VQATQFNARVTKSVVLGSRKNFIINWLAKDWASRRTLLAYVSRRSHECSVEDHEAVIIG
jgi:hypothetical protein